MWKWFKMCCLLLSKDLNNKEIKLKTNNRLLNAKIVGNLMFNLKWGNLYLNGINSIKRKQ